MLNMLSKASVVEPQPQNCNKTHKLQWHFTTRCTSDCANISQL